MLFIGSDHRGYLLKENIKKYLNGMNIEYKDCGTDSEESTDYPNFAKKVSVGVQTAEGNLGILICGTGIGMSIAANKFKGIRCALCNNSETAKFSRLHNNSNVLALAANTIKPETSIEIVKTWLATGFEANRHKKRLDIIEQIEKENFK